MNSYLIRGGKALSGNVKISGAKNSAVALVPASLLSDGIVKIDNIPDISDIDALNDKNAIANGYSPFTAKNRGALRGRHPDILLI